MATDTLQNEPIATNWQAVWDHAIEQLRVIELEFADIDAQHTAAFDAAEADCPDEREFFSRYNLGCYENKEVGRLRNFEAAWRALVREAGIATPIEDRDQSRQITTEARQVVERFDAWVKRRDEAHRKHDCDMWETRFNAMVDKRFAAQQAVIGAEAPDLKAMHVKLELLASMMDGMEDQGRVEAIRDDARRLVAA